MHLAHFPCIWASKMYRNAHWVHRYQNVCTRRWRGLILYQPEFSFFTPSFKATRSARPIFESSSSSSRSPNMSDASFFSIFFFRNLAAASALALMAWSIRGSTLRAIGDGKVSSTLIFFWRWRPLPDLAVVVTCTLSSFLSCSSTFCKESRSELVTLMKIKIFLLW